MFTEHIQRAIGLQKKGLLSASHFNGIFHIDQNIKREHSKAGDGSLIKEVVHNRVISPAYAKYLMYLGRDLSPAKCKDLC